MFSDGFERAWQQSALLPPRTLIGLPVSPTASSMIAVLNSPGVGLGGALDDLIVERTAAEIKWDFSIAAEPVKSAAAGGLS